MGGRNIELEALPSFQSDGLEILAFLAVAGGGRPLILAQLTPKGTRACMQYVEVRIELVGVEV